MISFTGLARSLGEPAVTAPASGLACLAARVDVVAEPPPPAPLRVLGSVVFARDFAVEGPGGELVWVPRAELVVEGDLAADAVDVERWPAELAPIAAGAPLGTRPRARELVVAVGARVELAADALVPLPPSSASPATHLARAPRIRVIG